MKLRNLKRFASLVTSLVMVFALAVPGFAASTEIEGNYEDVDLFVEVSESGNVIVNPFGLPYTVYEDDDNESVVAGEQITNPNPMTMVNRSAVPMSVVATVIGEIGEDAADLEFVTDLAAGTKAKKMVVNYEVFSTGLAEDDLEDDAKMYGELAKLNDKTPIASTLVTASASSTTAGDIVLTEGKKVEGDYQAVAGGIAMFRLSGKVTKTPPAGKEWSGDDTFNVTVAYTFEPAATTVLTDMTGTFYVDPVASVAEISIGNLPASASNVKWKSSNEEYVKVSDSNVGDQETLSATLTYVAPGESTITVMFNGPDGELYSATQIVKANPYVTVTDSNLSPSELIVGIATEGTITATFAGLITATDKIVTSGAVATVADLNTANLVNITGVSFDLDAGYVEASFEAVSAGDVTIEIRFKTVGADAMDYKVVVPFTIYSNE